MKSIGLKPIIAALAMASFATGAAAQYVWLDEKGTKQFSDMPPPASVPKKRILKEPHPAPAPQAAAENPSAPTATATSDVSASAKPNLPMTSAEKNADFQKRRAEQAEKDKKADEQAKLAASKAKNCESARNYNRSLNAGQRIATTDKNGERSYLTDAQRAQATQETNSILSDCK